MRISALLIDDDRELCGLMRDFFGEQDIDLSVANDSASGLALAVNGKFDIVLLDVMLPPFDGFNCLERLRKSSRVPVIMLTARTDHQSRIKGLDAGADDYLPKPFDPHELVARVRAILRRSSSPAPAGAPVLDLSGVRLDPAARNVLAKLGPVDVTSIEFDILEILMKAAGTIVSRDDLSQHLYQRDSSPFDRSIDVHISHLRKKLNDDGSLIRTVRGVGYQFCLTESA